MNKERLEPQGMLPIALSCDSQLVQRAFELLNTNGSVHVNIACDASVHVNISVYI